MFAFLHNLLDSNWYVILMETLLMLQQLFLFSSFLDSDKLLNACLRCILFQTIQNSDCIYCLLGSDLIFLPKTLFGIRCQKFKLNHITWVDWAASGYKERKPALKSYLLMRLELFINCSINAESTFVICS